MAMGKPIIASNIHVLEQTAGKAAVYFREDDIAQLSGMMEKILDDNDFASELGNKARLRCIENFSLKIMAEKLDQIIRSLTRAED